MQDPKNVIPKPATETYGTLSLGTREDTKDAGSTTTTKLGCAPITLTPCVDII